MKIMTIKNKSIKRPAQKFIHLGYVFILMVSISSALLNVDVISTYADKIPNLDVDRDDIDVTGQDACPEGSGNDDDVIKCNSGIIEGTDHADTIFVKTAVLGAIPQNGPSEITVYAKGSDDFVSGSDVDDNIYGQSGNDILQGNVGSDIMDGGSGNDAITGGIGSDYLAGDKGNDRLYGASEDDTLLGGDGADSFNCGDGVDTVLDFNSAQGDTIDQDCEIVNSV